MKKLNVTLLLLVCLFSVVLASCSNTLGFPDETTVQTDENGCVNDAHTDKNDDGYCDTCAKYVIVRIDFYAINDLHGKLTDSDTQCGAEELTTYFKYERATNENVILLSSGDMWQGSAESNSTKGALMTDWMNELDFTSMTLGNHEFDWGEEFIEANEKLAEFPFLAINVFDKETQSRVEYCDASVMVESSGIKVGIIGAIGDCYSSISGDKSEDIFFKTGRELTELVKAESVRLRELGADIIVYSLHDGYGRDSVSSLSNADLLSYYDVSLSDGYVDLVFEGHTHSSYVATDLFGVYHLQNGGENEGISHVEIAINSITDTKKVTRAEFVEQSHYEKLDSDPLIGELMQKYASEIAQASRFVGMNDAKRSSTALRSLVAELYYKAGMEKWGDKYKIVLGGGFISVRSPYELAAGEVFYSDLYSIFPFDNKLVLCSIQGSYLKSKFFQTSNTNYYIYYEDYGSDVRVNIDPNATYYVIVDSYSSSYAPNRLTVIEEYDSETFARDLLAEYIGNGGFTKSDNAQLSEKLNLYYADGGTRIDGKINVRFSPNSSNPSFQIEDSYKITDESEQRKILEYIMASEYYSQEVYGRTIESMLVEWKAHNDVYAVVKHERVQHTDFDRNDEGTEYWEFWQRGFNEIQGK